MQACKTYKHKPIQSHHISGLWLSYSAVRETKAKDEYQKLFLQTVAEKDGYVHQPHFLAPKTLVLCPVANETTKPVYFDDISGMVRHPLVIQQAHYYPFGLPMAKITTLGNPEYAYFFTGKELYEDEALEWYDYGARMYDVQIGRWTTTDPEWQDASPYVFCGNNAVNYIDPDGRKYWIPGFEGTQLDRWMAKNEQAIVNTSLAVAGVALMFTGVGFAGGLAIAGGMGFIGGAYSSQYNDETFWSGGLKGAVVGMVAYTTAAGISGALSSSGGLTRFMETAAPLAKGAAKAGIAFGSGAGTAFTSSVAADLMDDGDVQFKQHLSQYGRNMLLAGGLAAGISIGMSAYDYYDWDRLDKTQKLDKLAKAGKYDRSKLISDPNKIKKGIDYAQTECDGETINFTKRGLSSKSLAKGTLQHEMSHVADFKSGLLNTEDCLKAGNGIPTTTGDITERNAYLSEMKWARTHKYSLANYKDARSNYKYHGGNQPPKSTTINIFSFFF